MRLTLRTLLAYMDDILEPEDAQDIGKKVEESEFATNLLHRIRDVTRRLRLGAPAVLERGAGLDPNTVAEYLDNTLPADRVADFEKVCLESDVHLAEVASCHQVLTLVLGEPAEVDPNSRQRMYRLPDLVTAQANALREAAAAEIPETAPAAAEPVESPPSQAARNKVEVPEYLRETSRRRFSWGSVAAAIVAIVLGGSILAVIAYYRPGVRPVAVNQGAGKPGPDREKKAAGDGQAEKAAGAEAGSESTQKTPGSPEAHPAGPGSPSGGGSTAATKGPAGAERPAAGSQAGPAVAPAGPPSMPAGPAAQSPAVAAGPAGPAHPAGVAAPTEVASLPAQPPLAQPGGEGPNPAVPPGPSTEPAPLPPEDLGRLETGGEVLLKFDAGKGAWERVSGAALLKSQDRLLALPVFRPVISLPGKLRLQLIDGTLVQLLPSDPRGVPGVAVEYGQLILETDSETGASLRLRAGERLGVVTLTDAKSRVAIQVGRMEGSTADPETQPAPLAVDLYATQGKVLWQEGDLAPVAVSAPLELSLERQPLEAVAVTRLPDWANASLDTVDALDRRAAAALDKALDGTRGVTLVLRELADRPQREVSWLALRCLAHLGDYGLMVAALNNPDLKGFWPDYIEQLRAGVRRNPLSAAQVRTAMEKLYGPQGADLYELLWRYSDQGVSSEEATRLVRLLEDETLAVRVLSSWNLKRITGLGLYYQPEQTPAKRAPSVQKWKERLQSNPTLRGRSGPETEPPLGAPPAESGVLPSP